MNAQNSVLSLVALCSVGLLNGQARAAEIVTALAIDPTSNRLYFQFSVDQPADACRIIIKDSGGVIVKNVLFDPAGTVMGYANFVPGLTPDTDYTFNIRVRWTDSPAFDPEWVTLPFHTNP